MLSLTPPLPNTGVSNMVVTLVVHSTVGRALALHMADLGFFLIPHPATPHDLSLIPGTPSGPLNPARSIL